MASKRILLVEDDLWWGELLAEVLTKAGYQVTWFCRAHADGESGLNFMDADGKMAAFNAADYDRALVDGRMHFSPLNGWDVVPRLVAAGLPCVGMSGHPYFNQKMVEAGAELGMTKGDLWTGVSKGTVTL